MTNQMKDYLMIVIVIVVLFHITGLVAENIDIATTNSAILKLAFNPSEFRTSDLFNWFSVLVAGLAGIAVAVGVFTNNQSLIWSPLYAVFIFLGEDLLGIFTFIASLGDGVGLIFAVVLVSPLFIIYLVSALEWVRGM